MGKDLFHDAIGAMIAIMKRVSERIARAIDKTIIDRPGINTNAIERPCDGTRLAQPNERFIP